MASAIPRDHPGSLCYHRNSSVQMNHELVIIPGRHTVTNEEMFGVALHTTYDNSLVCVFPQSWPTREDAKEYMKSLRMAYMFGRRSILLETENESIQSSS